MEEEMTTRRSESETGKKELRETIKEQSQDKESQDNKLWEEKSDAGETTEVDVGGRFVITEDKDTQVWI